MLLKKNNVEKSKIDDIKEYLEKIVKENDIILTLGAGNITKLSEILTK